MKLEGERSIIVVGKCGNGKSATANSLLDSDLFKSEKNTSAVTLTCQMKIRRNKLGQIYRVVDTPGLFDDADKLGKRALEIQDALTFCPNPHAFLLVLNGAARFTEEECLSIDLLRVIFGQVMIDHTLIVFSRGAEFKDDDAFERFWRNTTCGGLLNLITLCKNRVTRIENQENSADDIARPPRARSIMKLVDEVSNNGQIFFQYCHLNIHTKVLRRTIATPRGETRVVLEYIVKDIGNDLDRSIWTPSLIGLGLLGAGVGIGLFCLLKK